MPTPQQRTRIQTLLSRSEPPDADSDPVTVKGWVKTVRSSGAVSFVQINDGSTFADLQIVVDASCPDYPLVTQLTTGCSVSVDGVLQESQGRGQRYEILAHGIEQLGSADPEEYPLQKKRHTLEFLRELAHLRPRTNTFGAMAPRPQRHGLRHPPVLPAARFPLRPDSHHHLQRRRGRRRHVPRHHAGRE